MRGNRRKVTWTDSAGNPHDLDYVLERKGASNLQGDPVAFIELAWRRYTKHSRNKAGEIEGALFHLKGSYPGVFAGAILGGEFTQGGLEQLHSHGTHVLHISFDQIADAFMSKGIDLDMPKASPMKRNLQFSKSWKT